MSSIGNHAFFLGIAVAFALIVTVVLKSMLKRSMELESSENQAPFLAPGPISSAVAAFVAPDAKTCAQALNKDHLDQLDERSVQHSRPVASLCFIESSEANLLCLRHISPNL